MFHAYTGCDSVSSFSTKGKKTAWGSWKSYNEVTTTFLALSAGPDEVPNEDVAVLERFTILLYDRTSDLISIDEGKGLQVALDLPSPGDCGWTDSNNWKPL